MKNEARRYHCANCSTERMLHKSDFVCGQPNPTCLKCGGVLRRDKKPAHTAPATPRHTEIQNPNEACPFDAPASVAADNKAPKCLSPEEKSNCSKGLLSGRSSLAQQDYLANLGVPREKSIKWTKHRASKEIQQRTNKPPRVLRSNRLQKYWNQRLVQVGLSAAGTRTALPAHPRGYASPAKIQTADPTQKR